MKCATTLQQTLVNPRPEVRGETDKAREKLVPLSLLSYVAQSGSSRSDSLVELRAEELLLGYLEDKSPHFTTSLIGSATCQDGA